MKRTTLIYIERDESYLMLYRNKKKEDINEGKWIGIGGKIEEGESPEECVIRESLEETGLIVKPRFRGTVSFISLNNEKLNEKIYLYSSKEFKGEIHSCPEGELKWVKKEDIFTLNLWEGDKIFLERLLKGEEGFSLELVYEADRLLSWNEKMSEP